MSDLNFIQTFALLALDGLEGSRGSAALRSVDRCLSIAEPLSDLLDLDPSPTELEHTLEEFPARHKENQTRGKELRDLVYRQLFLLDAMDQGPALIGSDMDFETADNSLWEYRAAPALFEEEFHALKQELLESPAPSSKSWLLFWLLRECGALPSFFDQEQQQTLLSKSKQQEESSPAWHAIFHWSLDHPLDHFLKNAKQAKESLFRSPYLQGVTVNFPYLQRRSAIFIDLVVLGTTVKDRREGICDYLIQRGHRVQQVKHGTETLLRIDNGLYRIWPTTRRAYRVPIQGVTLLPFLESQPEENDGKN